MKLAGRAFYPGSLENRRDIFAKSGRARLFWVIYEGARFILNGEGSGVNFADVLHAGWRIEDATKFPTKLLKG